MNYRPVQLDRETTLETFRDAVLRALDDAARQTFNPPRNDAGATDADLPRLFAAIDAQVEALAERYRCALVTPVITHPMNRYMFGRS